MQKLLREGLSEKVTLAYLDPPFMTQKKYEMEGGQLAFDDRWLSRAHYFDHLMDRVRLIYALLAPHGSMVLHVDSKMSHYVKVYCDEIFGLENFASEIVWRYRRWPSKTKNFQRVHDVLLRYRKDMSVEPRFHQLYEPLAASTLETWGTTKQAAVFNAKGKRTKSSRTAEVTKGVPLGDVWDIGIIAPVSKERSGFPMQKPVALLQRLVGALSNEGDIVFDPYCGSGTTLVAATGMKRHAIGIDSSLVAVEIAKERLAGATSLQRTA